MIRMRGFEEVDNKFIKHNDVDTVLPTRGTSRSAGYDFRIKERLVIEPHSTVITSSDVKAYMQEDEVLELYIRSSIGIKNKVRLSNSVAVIDSDYYSNPKNDGSIGIPLHNYGDETVILECGERVCQGVFKEYLVADNCDASGIREGGIGSTGKR